SQRSHEYHLVHVGDVRSYERRPPRQDLLDDALPVPNARETDYVARQNADARFAQTPPHMATQHVAARRVHGTRASDRLRYESQIRVVRSGNAGHDISNVHAYPPGPSRSAGVEAADAQRASAMSPWARSSPPIYTWYIAPAPRPL